MYESYYEYLKLEDEKWDNYVQNSDAGEQAGTSQYTQDEIEEIFEDCLESISQSITNELDNNFRYYNFNPIFNKIDRNCGFNGTMFKMNINKNTIEVKVIYGSIGDIPSEESFVSVKFLINGEEIEIRDIKFINGEYGWDNVESLYYSITQDEFLFTEKDIDEFVEKLIDKIKDIVCIHA